MFRVRRPIAVALLLAAAGCTARHRACAPPELTRESGLVQPGPADDADPIETELLRSLADRTRTAHSPPTWRRGRGSSWPCPAAGCTAPTRSAS